MPHRQRRSREASALDNKLQRGWSASQRDSFALGNRLHEFAQLAVTQPNEARSIGFSAHRQLMCHRGGAVEKFLGVSVRNMFEREEHSFSCTFLDRCCVPLVRARRSGIDQQILLSTRAPAARSRPTGTSHRAARCKLILPGAER